MPVIFPKLYVLDFSSADAAAINVSAAANVNNALLMAFFIIVRYSFRMHNIL